MSDTNSKRYGVDGPPQLQGASRGLSEQLAQRCGWSPCADDDWLGEVVCTCAESSRFRILQGDENSNVDWLQGRWGHSITDLECASCGFRIPLFHEGFHGYNAVVCGERDEMPEDYLQTNRQLLKPVQCDKCKGEEFGVAVLARYDLRDGLSDTPIDYWDDAYGWFRADAWCFACTSVKSMVVGHETA
jgi:hypothetical protein